MTTVCFASVKGAPGVTTLTTLVGGAWPDHRGALVAECDPSGGDLAVRFQLSAKCGWASVATATRRLDGAPPLLPHLQSLPGGLLTMVGPRFPLASESMPRLIELALEAASRDGPWDVLVDLGRLGLDGLQLGWVDRSDAVLVVTATDAASVLHVHDRATSLLSRCGHRIGLVLVGSAGYGSQEIEEFTGIPVIAQLPFDAVAAAALAGHPINQRRMARSSLLGAGRQLALTLSGEAEAAARDGGSESLQPLPEGSGLPTERVGGRPLGAVGCLARGRASLARPLSTEARGESVTTDPVSEPVHGPHDRVVR
jgi:hypothetical protein